MYVYIQSECSAYDSSEDRTFDLYTVGFYDPTGSWTAESDHYDKEKAAERVAWLNGSGKV